MLSRPADLTDADVIGGIAAGWGLTLHAVEWVPVGFGSHHWLGTEVDGRRWFVTVDDLDHSICDASGGRDDTFERLRGALEVATRARGAGLRFVVAPQADHDGRAVRRLGRRHALAVYPLVVGRTGTWGPHRSRETGLAVLDLVIDLHQATATIGGDVPRDAGAVSRLDALLGAGDPAGERWRRGPYGERAQRLICEHLDDLTHHASRHAALWTEVCSPDRLVVTHGEPHPGNTMETTGGWCLLDWDTARLAPPERDLWMLVESVPDCVDVYAARTGRPVLSAGLELYELGWSLSDAAAAATLLRLPHEDTEDAREEWAILQRTLHRLEASRR